MVMWSLCYGLINLCDLTRLKMISVFLFFFFLNNIIFWWIKITNEINGRWQKGHININIIIIIEAINRLNYIICSILTSSFFINFTIIRNQIQPFYFMKKEKSLIETSLCYKGWSNKCLPPSLPPPQKCVDMFSFETIICLLFYNYSLPLS